MKAVYGYIRVSTTKQGEGTSLAAQKDAIIAYARKYDLEITKWFEEKETAAKQGRPLFSIMMKLLKERKATGVIIHKIDRSARNLRDWADLGTLIDEGIEVHFAHESLDLHARGGRLSADIQAVIAADYIRNLRQETIKGIHGRFKQGLLPLPAPIGYLNSGPGKAKVIDPVQGVLVRKAFELYSTEQYSLKTLAPYMQKLGLRNTKNKAVNINSLSILLNNPFYMGFLQFKGELFNGIHEPIISPSLFKRVQQVLLNKTNQKARSHYSKYSKLLKCHYCRYSLNGEIQKGHIYYRCHTKGCITKGLRETTIDNLLAKTFEAAELLPEEANILEELLSSTQQNWLKKQEELIKSTLLHKSNLEYKLDRLTDCYVEGGLDKETYDKRKQKLLIELKEKQFAHEGFSEAKHNVFAKAQKFLELGKSLTYAFKSANSANQRRLVKIVTSNLVVDGKYLITAMRSPFKELVERHNLTHGSPKRYVSRNMDYHFCYLEPNTSPILLPAVSKQSLENLLNRLLASTENLQDILETSEP